MPRPFTNQDLERMRRQQGQTPPESSGQQNLANIPPIQPIPQDVLPSEYDMSQMMQGLSIAEGDRGPAQPRASSSRAPVEIPPLYQPFQTGQNLTPLLSSGEQRRPDLNTPQVSRLSRWMGTPELIVSQPSGSPGQESQAPELEGDYMGEPGIFSQEPIPQPFVIPQVSQRTFVSSQPFPETSGEPENRRERIRNMLRRSVTSLRRQDQEADEKWQKEKRTFQNKDKYKAVKYGDQTRIVLKNVPQRQRTVGSGIISRSTRTPDQIKWDYTRRRERWRPLSRIGWQSRFQNPIRARHRVYGGPGHRSSLRLLNRSKRFLNQNPPKNIDFQRRMERMSEKERQWRREKGLKERRTYRRGSEYSMREINVKSAKSNLNKRRRQARQGVWRMPKREPPPDLPQISEEEEEEEENEGEEEDEE